MDLYYLNSLVCFINSHRASFVYWLFPSSFSLNLTKMITFSTTCSCQWPKMQTICWNKAQFYVTAWQILLPDIKTSSEQFLTDLLTAARRTNGSMERQKIARQPITTCFFGYKTTFITQIIILTAWQVLQKHSDHYLGTQYLTSPYVLWSIDLILLYIVYKWAYFTA